MTGEERLSFYDAIAPIVESDSLDMDIVYQKSRYDEGPGDYLNCPMDMQQYHHFIHELANGSCVPLRDFESAKYFEGCLPIEVMCSRGVETLRFGPMKPVGLPDPRNSKDPYAVVQLRKENIEGSHYNIVGFHYFKFCKIAKFFFICSAFLTPERLLLIALFFFGAVPICINFILCKYLF